MFSKRIPKRCDKYWKLKYRAEIDAPKD